MEDITFYGFDFVPLETVGKYISVNFKNKYCGYGSFEAHFSINEKRILDMLEENTYILCACGENQAVVTGWQLGEDIAVFGQTPEWLMTKRVMPPMSPTYIKTENVVRTVVSIAMGDFVTLGELKGLGKEKEFSTVDARTVYDICCELCNSEGFGFRLRADFVRKTFIFFMYCGVERNAMMSVSNKSAYDMTYTFDVLDMATNSGWYESRTEDSGGTTSSEWVFLNNGTETGARRWDCLLSGVKTLSEAKAQIDEQKATEEIEAKVRRLVYGEDFDLGDVVRVQVEKGDFKRTLSRRISEVWIFNDVDESGIRPVLSKV